MSQTETLSPDKRLQIIDGAAAVFSSDGYEGASMARIAERAGVSKGTLYNHFESKAELFAAWVQIECEQILGTIFDLSDVDMDPRSALLLLGGRIVRMLISDTARTVHRVVLSEAAKFPHLAEDFFAAGPSRALGIMARWLASCAEQGLLRVDDPALAAEQFFALCHTRLHLRRQLGLIGEPTSAEIDLIVRAAVEMFLNTYGHAALR